MLGIRARTKATVKCHGKSGEVKAQDMESRSTAIKANYSQETPTLTSIVF
jgi:hypothetical protein